MATSNEPTNTLWEKVNEIAIEQQQQFYELLPDCIAYEPEEHKYLKQNIGYALFGPPKGNKEECTANNDHCYSNAENETEDADIADTVIYDKEANTTINMIYDKACKYAEINSDSNKPMYFAIIYNVVFCCKKKENDKDHLKKVEDDLKKDKDNLKKAEDDFKKDKDNLKKAEDDLKKAEGDLKKDEGDLKKDEGDLKKNEEPFIIIPIPIFKIWKNMENIENATKNKKTKTQTVVAEESYEIAYIDNTGRVYKSWTNYMTNNNLFKCTMVVPKNGWYQPDPTRPITKDYSTVWLEITDSPACSWKAAVKTGIDIASCVAGLGAVGLAGVSLFTPLAPVIATGLVVSAGASSVWTIGRGAEQLIDRSVHEESIHIANKDAFPQWLAITGSAFGLGALGGSAAISTALSRGMTVNTAARVAFNTVQSGNLLVNGVGILYQGYYMIDKYLTQKQFDYIDALSLVTHVMFFAGSVVSTQFAGDIIENTQGRIINDYKESLRNKRLRKQFNRVQRKATQNNSCKMSENAEIIRYINNRNDLSAAGITTKNHSTPKQSNNEQTTDTSSGNQKMSKNASAKSQETSNTPAENKTTSKLSSKDTSAPSTSAENQKMSKNASAKSQETSNTPAENKTTSKLSSKDTSTPSTSAENQKMSKNASAKSQETSNAPAENKTTSKLSSKDTSAPNISAKNQKTSNVPKQVKTIYDDKTNNISNIIWSFDNGKLKVNDIVLLDPIEFVTRLAKLGIFISTDTSLHSYDFTNDNNTNTLLQTLTELLSNYYLSSECPRSYNLPTVPDFKPLLTEMRLLNINEDTLTKLFTITITLLKHSPNAEDFLLQTFRFIWLYCVDNLKQWGIYTRLRMQSSSASNILYKIITAIFEAIDIMLSNLYPAFEKYIATLLGQIN